MKKLIMSFVAIFGLFCHGYAQSMDTTGSYQEPTTEVEYNYLTKGYQTSMEQGIDMKKGYRMEKLISSGTKDVKCDFYGFYRDGEAKPCATLCILKTASVSTYLCIPSYAASQELWNNYYSKMSLLYESSQLSMMYGLAKLAAYNGD